MTKLVAGYQIGELSKYIELCKKAEISSKNFDLEYEKAYEATDALVEDLFSRLYDYHKQIYPNFFVHELSKITVDELNRFYDENIKIPFGSAVTLFYEPEVLKYKVHFNKDMVIDCFEKISDVTKKYVIPTVIKKQEN